MSTVLRAKDVGSIALVRPAETLRHDRRLLVANYLGESAA